MGDVIQTNFVTRDDFIRLEGKLDRVSDAINRLVLIEERQTNQAAVQALLEQRQATMAELQAVMQQRLARLEDRYEVVGSLQKSMHDQGVELEATNKKIDSWVNRGIGVWVAASLIATVLWKVYKG